MAELSRATVALSWSQRLALAAVRAYQLSVSALVGRQCRYLPGCSDYAAEAVRLHGVWPGTWIGLARLCRCHPWGPWGYDPVPLRCHAVDPWRPWRYGRWRMSSETAEPSAAADQERASNSAASP